MVHTAFQGIADGLLSTDSLLKISAMRNILGYSIVVVCISILINKSGAVALTCGSSFYIQHKTPDFEKPGACGIISLCY